MKFEYWEDIQDILNGRTSFAYNPDNANFVVETFVEYDK